MHIYINIYIQTYMYTCMFTSIRKVYHVCTYMCLHT